MNETTKVLLGRDDIRDRVEAKISPEEKQTFKGVPSAAISLPVNRMATHWELRHCDTLSYYYHILPIT